MGLKIDKRYHALPGYRDTDTIRAELAEAEANNRALAVELARERYAEYEALSESRESARKRLESSRDALVKIEESVRDLEGRVARLTLTGDDDALQTARESYRGIVEKYRPNAIKAIERDERTYAATEYDERAANAELAEEMEYLAALAGFSYGGSPHAMPEEGRKLYEIYVAPAKSREKEFRKEQTRRKHAENFERAIDEGRGIHGDGTKITR